MRPYVLLAAFLFALLAAPASARSGEPRSVLLFLPEDSTTPAMIAITAGLRATVLEGWDGPVTFSVEHLDLSWFQGPAYQAQLLGFYRAKYASYRPDAIVTLGDDAVPILVEMRRELWPGVPLAFINQDERAAVELAKEPGVTALWGHYEARRTVESALTLLPETRRVALVLGSSPWEQIERARFLEELAPLAGRVEIVDLSGLSYAELESRLGALPGDAVVLFHTFYVDAVGQRFVSAQLLDRLRPVVRRPVFTVHAVYFGRGVAGGAMMDYERLGRDLGGVTLRLLHGEATSSIPVRAADLTVFAFDARELDRFGVPDRRLPAGAELRFREPSMWSRYRWQMTAALGAGALQTGLIAVLLVERRRRARAQASTAEARVETERARDQLVHLNRVAALAELSSSLAHELNQPLAAILSTAQAAQRMLGAASLSADQTGEALADIVAADTRAGKVIGRIRALLRKSEARVDRCDLGEIAREVGRIIEHDARLRRIALVSELAPGVLWVRGDAVRLQQVALNLMSNALDAVERHPPGGRKVTVRTALSGDHAELSVEDSGGGVAGGDFERIFEPFFTTKPEGLGMGLAISRSIAEAHGGHLRAERAPGGGTLVRCLLPVAGGENDRS